VQKRAILKYRIQYRAGYKEFVTFTTKQYLKHIISKFLQNYFHIKFTIKLTNLGNPLHDKKYHYVCFPLKKDKNRKLNPKLNFRKKMKMINMSAKQRESKHKHKMRYLCINANTRRFFTKNPRINKQKKELKQVLTHVGEDTKFRTNQPQRKI